MLFYLILEAREIAYDLKLHPFDLQLAQRFEDFPVLENGVGMLARFKHEFDTYLKKISYTEERRTVSLVTGTIAEKFIAEQVEKLKKKAPNIEVLIYPIKNYFFGEYVSVTGLLTGQDIIKQLKDKPLGDTLLVSDTMLKDREIILLDDTTTTDISIGLEIPVTIVENDGGEFIKSILQIKE